MRSTSFCWASLYLFRAVSLSPFSLQESLNCFLVSLLVLLASLICLLSLVVVVVPAVFLPTTLLRVVIIISVSGFVCLLPTFFRYCGGFVLCGNLHCYRVVVSFGLFCCVVFSFEAVGSDYTLVVYR